MGAELSWRFDPGAIAEETVTNERGLEKLLNDVAMMTCGRGNRRIIMMDCEEMPMQW